MSMVPRYPTTSKAESGGTGRKTSLRADPAEERLMLGDEPFESAIDRHAKPFPRSVVGRTPALAGELVGFLLSDHARIRRDHVDAPAEMGDAPRRGEEHFLVFVELRVRVRERPEEMDCRAVFRQGGWVEHLSRCGIRRRSPSRLATTSRLPCRPRYRARRGDTLPARDRPDRR